MILPSKKAGETIQVSFDFTSSINLSGTTETISTQSVAATVYSGTDSNPSAIISGSASASGSVVTQLITAGTAGVIYSLVCTITTSLGQTVKQSALLAIEATSEGVP